MNRILPLALVTGALVLALVGFAPQRRRPVLLLPAPLDAYPDQEALGVFGHWHLTEPEGQQKSGLALFSWSSAGSMKNWNAMMVDDRVNLRSVRYSWDSGVSSGGYGNVRPDRNPKAFQRLLDRLGPSDPPPPIASLLLVSFRRKGRWTTRIYDTRIAPSSYKAIHEYLFAPDPPRTSTGSLVGSPSPSDR